MTILGLGIDIVEINRIANLVLRYGDKLAKRILCYRELQLYKKNKQPIRFLATRFAVKEAALKAFGTGLKKEINFKHVEVFNDKNGKPYLKIWYKSKLKTDYLVGIIHIHVSITDERNYAVATVIIDE
ncbi:MAG: holo-ACP synthase [Candidatus Dasytiphilus stammeri]